MTTQKHMPETPLVVAEGSADPPGRRLAVKDNPAGAIKLIVFGDSEHPAYMPAVIEVQGRSRTIRHIGRVYGLGQHRAVTFAVSIGLTDLGERPLFADAMRLDWQRDGSLRGVMYSRSAAVILRDLYQRRNAARSDIVRDQAQSSIDSLSTEFGQFVCLAVTHGLEHVIPHDQKDVREELKITSSHSPGY